MKITDLQFDYPEKLVATQPDYPSRVMWVDAEPQEFTFAELLQRIPAGDVLVINNTKVLKRRVFAGDLEILFLKQHANEEWDVLFPSKKYKLEDQIILPENVQMTLVQKGRPQRVRTNVVLDEDYFSRVAELPLPPYIQKARDQRHTVAADESWYQTAWASTPGSFAAPTASLHFKPQDILALQNRGVEVCELTLHVGLGTFLPVASEDLDQHDMHEEYSEISPASWHCVQKAKADCRKIWALGTTSTRSLESAAGGLLKADHAGGFAGFTKLLIQPGYEFKVVDYLMTNFHQPESTLLALVSAFAGLDKVKACYRWAIERNFRLFSYGDLSVWTTNQHLPIRPTKCQLA